MSTTLTIPITTSPIAALLAGMGVARWLEHTGRDLIGDQIEVRVANAGYGIIVTTPADIDPSMIGHKSYQPSLPRWILTAKNGPAPSGVPSIDYEDERKHNSDYFERLKQLRKERGGMHKLSVEEQYDLDAMAPHDYWPVAAMINQMGAISSYNKAVERWTACRLIYPELVKIIWMMCSGEPAAIEQAEQQWVVLAKQHGLEKSATLPAMQAVNPEQGKGANKPKSDGLSIGGMDGFWLLEYFKFAGLYLTSLPRTVQGKKDRKTYVVIPSRGGMSLTWHDTVFGKFQKAFYASSAIKMDILASLRYTSTMLQEWEGAQRSSGRRRRPSDYVDGLAVAFFKDLGSAFAVMNVASIGLPDWIDWPESLDMAQQLQEVITHHQRIIGALDESRGEEERLLRNYRDFLSSRDPSLQAFFSFTTGYASHTLRMMSKNQPIRRLTTNQLEMIIMAQEESRSKKLKPIIDNVGFQRIATAIRQSTVTQQFFKAKNGDNTYEIRYGLADELHRRSRDDHEFIRALDKFLQEYSQENARIMERAKGKPYRRRIAVSTSDISQLVELIDEYGASTIASMLIAFGYARDTSSAEEGNPTADTSLELEEPAAIDQDEEQPF